MPEPRTVPHRRRLLTAVTVGAIAWMLPTGATAVPCDTALVTHSPAGSEGDPAAVALTSQVLVADTPGWERMSWQAADGVELDEVVVTADGTTTTLPGTPTGDAGPVESITFCGTQDPGIASEGATQGADADTDVVTAVSAGSPASGASSTGGTGFGDLGLLGATIGVGLAGVVLLLSRGARRSSTSDQPTRQAHA